MSNYSIFAQQEAMFTHYMFNTQAINPAYAGSVNALSVATLNRTQWMGFDGAPVTQTLALNTPFVTQNIGLGLSVLNDKIGHVNTTYLFADFAYKIKLNSSSWLSFGLKAGANYRRVNFTDMNLSIDADPDFAQNLMSEWLPNFGAGVYYFTKKFYIGLSVPKILENDFNADLSSIDNAAGEQKHYFLITGFSFDLNDSWQLKPAAFIKYTKSAPVQFDISSQFIYNKKFWLGTMFRTGDAAGALVGYYITPQLSVGYSYDWSYANKTFVYNTGSHEVFLRFDAVFSDNKEIISPRTF